MCFIKNLRMRYEIIYAQIVPEHSMLSFSSFYHQQIISTSKQRSRICTISMCRVKSPKGL
jgi:hypothetical protein